MAKPLSPKSTVIRDAIKRNPDLANKELAELINGSEARKDDKLKVTGNDVAQQKLALKNLGEAAPAKKPASKPAAKATPQVAASRPQVTVPAMAQAGASPLEAAKQVKELVDRYGAETVKGLAELFGGK